MPSPGRPLEVPALSSGWYVNVTHPEKGVTIMENSSGLKGRGLGGGVLGEATELQRIALTLTPVTTTARILGLKVLRAPVATLPHSH